jgi:hypothetical protein
MAGKRGRWGTQDGLPVEELHLTLTLTDGSPHRLFHAGDHGIAIVRYRVGSEKFDQKEVDDGRLIQVCKRTLVGVAYAIVDGQPGTEVLDLFDAEISAKDLTDWVLANDAARRDQAQSETKARASVTEDIGPPGTEGNN